MHYLGVDLGGTNLVAAVVTEDGQITARAAVPTPKGAEPILDAMAQVCRDAVAQTPLDWQEIASVGVGSPGIADPTRGVLEYSCNLNFYNVPLAAELSRRLDGKPVFIENDANAAALGEYAVGAGRGSRSLVAITLGTGVGGGVVLDGKLLTGHNFAGAEMGHFVMVMNGEPCNCGRRGCFEAYASATALIRETRRAMEQHRDSKLWQVAGSLENVNGRTVFDARALGDEAAEGVFRRYCEALACGVTSMVNIFQPEVLCIGGGICAQGETLLAPVREILDREDYARASRRRVRLVTAQLGNDAGLIGAAFLPKYQ
jgi:glucokinase